MEDGPGHTHDKNKSRTSGWFRHAFEEILQDMILS